MTQVSGPLTDQTFTDDEWRAILGAEPAIVGDVTGGAYGLTLATSSDTATLGDASWDSTSAVGGFMHRIPAGQQEGVTIGPATSAAREDIIVVRYDPTWAAVEPGPCRLAVVTGAEGATTTFDSVDDGPPGTEDMPLWSVTRRPNEALSQATVRDLRVRTGPNLLVRTVADLRANVPVGTHAHVQDTGDNYIRALNAQQSPVWALRRRGPFLQRSGVATFPSFLATQHQTTVSLPSEFTVPPVVQVTLVTTGTSPGIVVTAYDVTRTSFKVQMFHTTSTAAFVSDGRSVHWTATQATATSASG